MGHQAQYVTAFAQDAGDVVKRAVGIRLASDLPVRSCVAEDDPALVFESLQGFRIAIVVPFHMPDGDPQHLPLAAGISKRRSSVFNPEVDVLANVLEAGVADESPREQACLA